MRENKGTIDKTMMYEWVGQQASQQLEPKYMIMEKNDGSTADTKGCCMHPLYAARCLCRFLRISPIFGVCSNTYRVA